MATYVIECTISELTKKNDSKISIKISGSEGYSVKQDKETYNIFCPKDMPKHGKMKLCYIINAGASITVCQTYETILMQASISGKRVRLTIPDDILKSAVQSNADKASQNPSASSEVKPKADEPPQDKVTSVTVLSE